jgi:hypothetical protein
MTTTMAYLKKCPKSLMVKKELEIKLLWVSLTFNKHVKLLLEDWLEVRDVHKLHTPVHDVVPGAVDPAQDAIA